MSISIISPDPTVRLRLATRIHFALLRYCGEQVSVSTLLAGDDEAREAMWVCEASGNADMVSLALQFAQAIPPAPHQSRPDAGIDAAVRRAAPQDAAWAQDTSGFGVSQPANASEPAARPPASAGWLNPANWRRRATGR